MTVYQFYNPQPVLLNLPGIGPIPNGKVYFYELGTTTPKDTWSDYATGAPVLNSNPVLLDSSGRPSTEIWLDGEYSVKVDDGDDVTIDTFDMRPAADDAASIPIPEEDEYLGGDGSAYIAKTYRGMPDPTGLVGYVPVSDGEGYIMQPLPEAPPAPEIPIANPSVSIVKVGTMMFQLGTGTVPAASGSKTSSVNITFAEAFTGTPTVFPKNSTPGGSTSSGACAVLVSSSESTTGATITANIPDDDSRTEWKLGNATNFSYVAIGPCLSPDA